MLNLLTNHNLWDPFYYAQAPEFEINTTDKGYAINMDLPGVAQEDLNITVKKQYLTISGHRKDKDTKFSKTFTLAEDLDRDAIEAALNNGVLKLIVPRKADASEKKIMLKLNSAA